MKTVTRFNENQSVKFREKYRNSWKRVNMFNAWKWIPSLTIFNIVRLVKNKKTQEISLNFLTRANECNV